jgi:hypothetical protein
VLVGAGDGGLSCPGPSLAGAVEVIAAELSGGAEGAARSGAPGDADGVNLAVAANRAEALNPA